MQTRKNILTRQRLNSGSAAWLVHRVSGIALSAYIFVHLFVLSSIRDKAAFERFIELSHTWPVRSLELALLGIVAAHGLNGLRLILLDMGAPTRIQKPLLYIAIIFWIAIMAAAAPAMLSMGGIVQ